MYSLNSTKKLLKSKKTIIKIITTIVSGIHKDSQIAILGAMYSS